MFSNIKNCSNLHGNHQSAIEIIDFANKSRVCPSVCFIGDFILSGLMNAQKT